MVSSVCPDFGFLISHYWYYCIFVSPHVTSHLTAMKVKVSFCFVRCLFLTWTSTIGKLSINIRHSLNSSVWYNLWVRVWALSLSYNNIYFYISVNIQEVGGVTGACSPTTTLPFHDYLSYNTSLAHLQWQLLSFWPSQKSMCARCAWAQPWQMMSGHWCTVSVLCWLEWLSWISQPRFHLWREEHLSQRSMRD